MIVLFVLFLPLISSIFATCYAFSPRARALGFACSFFMLLAFISALVVLPFYFGTASGYSFVDDVSIAPWLPGAPFGLRIDQTTAAMMAVVTGVATCVHFYSIYYMSADEHFNKFFAFLGLFVFSMLVLVMSNNLLLMFVGWEGVGLCSWMLIGFWYERAAFSRAANEAFIMNRISDFAMLLGIFIIYWLLGSLKFEDILSAVMGYAHEPNGLPSELSIAAALLFVGAMGKSAQFPFHTWLANAMAGPTPVSALIHAATMVTAGVFLLIRLSPLYAALPELSAFIAGLGAFVAVFAASMALAARDLKRIVAFSTLSQLGYMFAACGLGAYSIALFHLITHAFFKALLFLGAGNVMHAMHDELDIFKMGGLGKKMKITLIFMIVGSLALCGVWPFAGFFSKDAILGAAATEGSQLIYGALLLAAVFTAFYSFRLIMLVFSGAPRSEAAKHAHEASALGLLAMAPLAVLAVLAGGLFEHFFVKEHFENEFALIAASLAAAAVGIISALVIYAKKSAPSENPLLKLLANEYYIERFYNAVIVRAYVGLSLLLAGLEWLLYNFFFALIPWIFHSLARALSCPRSDLGAANRAFVYAFSAAFVIIILILGAAVCLL